MSTTYHDLDSDTAFTARIAAIEAAPDAPESWTATIDRAAAALYQAFTGNRWAWAPDDLCDTFHDLATAALRAAHEPLDGAA